MPTQDCLARVWQPGLGDPSPGGLALTALYLVASVMFLRTVLVRRDWLPGERRLWWLSTLFILALALNKQLDLHQAAQRTVRCLIYDGDNDRIAWIKHRVGFALIGVGALVLAWFLYASRRALAANGLLILGLVLMALFIALEAARFSDVINYTLGDLVEIWRLHRVLEGLALITLIAAAWTRARRG